MSLNTKKEGGCGLKNQAKKRKEINNAISHKDKIQL